MKLELTMFSSGLALPGLVSTACSTQGAANLTIQTITGIYTGLQNLNFTGVREFRNVPFAQPPVGTRRFMPPEALPPSTKHHYSYRKPPSCP